MGAEGSKASIEESKASVSYDQLTVGALAIIANDEPENKEVLELLRNRLTQERAPVIKKDRHCMPFWEVPERREPHLCFGGLPGCGGTRPKGDIRG